MSGFSPELSRKSRSSTAPLRVSAVLGLLLAVGVLVLVAFIAPDDGIDASSLQQGIGLAATIAAVPVALLLRPAEPWRGVALGGAMALAGFSMTFGGNLIGLLMAIAGISILLAGASQRPSLTLGLVVRLVGYAILLGAAMWLSLGESTMPQTLASLVVAVIVSTSPLWDRPSESAP